MLDRMSSARACRRPSEVATIDQVRAARRVVGQIYIDDRVRDYIVHIVQATREPRDVRPGRARAADRVRRLAARDAVPRRRRRARTRSSATARTSRPTTSRRSRSTSCATASSSRTRPRPRRSPPRTSSAASSSTSRCPSRWRSTTAELFKKAQEDRDRVAPARRRAARRPVPLRVQGPRPVFSRRAAVLPGRRRPRDRLEHHGAHERAARQAVRRGARPHREPHDRHERVGATSARAAATKRELAAELAAVVAFSAIKNNDRVGLYIVTDKVEKLRAAQEGPAPRAARDRRDPRVPAARRAAPTSRRASTSSARSRGGGRSCSWSRDFLSRRLGARDARSRAQRHELVPVVVGDPLEAELPAVGLVVLEDLETGELVEVDTTAACAAASSRARARRRPRRATRRCAGSTSTSSRSAPNEPYVDALIAFFKARAKRMAHG